MSKHLLAAVLLPALISTSAHACPTFHTLTNGTTADATQVMENFSYVLCSPSFTEKVGIGTTATQMLEVERNLNFGTVAVVRNGNSGGSAYAAWITSNGSSSGSLLQTGANATGFGPFVANQTIISADGAGGLFLGTEHNYPVLMGVNNTEVARFTSAGLGIGTTSPSYTLHVNGSVAGTSAYNNLSDIRLKKNIKPISNALDLIEKLRGVRFNWRTPQERDVGVAFELPISKPQVGFLAQEVGLVLPEAVTVADGKDAIMSMEETKVVPLLVEAVKELALKNSGQAETISELQHEVVELRQAIRVKVTTASASH